MHETLIDVTRRMRRIPELNLPFIPPGNWKPSMARYSHVFCIDLSWPLTKPLSHRLGLAPLILSLRCTTIAIPWKKIADTCPGAAVLGSCFDTFHCSRCAQGIMFHQEDTETSWATSKHWTLTWTMKSWLIKKNSILKFHALYNFPKKNIITRGRKLIHFIPKKRHSFKDSPQQSAPPSDYCFWCGWLSSVQERRDFFWGGGVDELELWDLGSISSSKMKFKPCYLNNIIPEHWLSIETIFSKNNVILENKILQKVGQLHRMRGGGNWS